MNGYVSFVNAEQEGIVSVRRERRGRVEIVTLDRPESRNAIDGPTTAALEAAFTELEADDGVGAVVLTGAGDRAFCAGVDLKMHAAEGADAFATVVTERGGFAAVTRRDFPKPVVAAVNGYALGGGFEIVLACDLVVAAETAEFGFPEVTLGLLADAGGLIRLPNRIPFALASEIVLTGERFGAARALELGLVNRVVPAERVLDEAVDLAQRIAENAPVSVLLSKQLLRESLSVPEAEAWKLNDEFMAAIMRSEDFDEGPRAWVEKRRARWTGR